LANFSHGAFSVKDQLEGLVNQMVERGILFEKPFANSKNALLNGFWIVPKAISLAPRQL